MSSFNQDAILDEFRSQVEEFLPDNLIRDDVFLMRWLIARNFAVDKAVIMLKNCMTWREENEIDKILEWNPPDDLKKACPYEISFHDLDGRPVLLFPWAKWTPWEFTDNGRREEYLKYMYQMLERCIAAIKYPATQFVIIADSEGFSFRHMSHVKAIDANLELLKGFECRYPELMNLAIAVNTPKVFSVLFSIIKPLMSNRTLQKLEIFDSNSAKWKKSLVQYIAETELPERYGGRRRSETSHVSVERLKLSKNDNSAGGPEVQVMA